MILRKYGTSYHSVRPNFNPAAMTEIGFSKDQEHQVSVEDFDASYEAAGEVLELVAEADGEVQREAETAVLAALEESVLNAEGALGEGHVLVVLNDRKDQPKTRERREDVIVDGENRFYFRWSIDPALKVQAFREV